MEAKYAPSKISYSELEIKAHYGSGASHVSKELKPFEEMRLHTILDTVELRKNEGKAFLEKAEFLILVEWRAHQTKAYSFAAHEQAAKNSITKIRETTQRAFEEYETNKENMDNPIKILGELEGVPLQTATLILATYDPVNLPYFSDELHWYLHWEEDKAGKRHAARYITQSMKEYSIICAKVNDIRKRFVEESGKVIRAVDIENAARLLCHHAKIHARLHPKKADDSALVPEEKPRKKRKTAAQIWEEEHPRGTEKDPFRHIHNTVDKGRSGSPTFDDFGFQMDYDKCVDWEKPTTRAMLRPSGAKMNRQMAKWKQDDEDLKRMAELMDDTVTSTSSDGHAVNNCAKKNAYMEKVRNDLGMTTYHVTLGDFEKWHEKGYCAKKGEFNVESWDEEKKKRYLDMSVGCALRK